MLHSTPRNIFTIGFCAAGLWACGGGSGDGGSGGGDTPVGVVQGKLGAPPGNGIAGGLKFAGSVGRSGRGLTSGYGQSRPGLAVEELTILFTHEQTQEEVEAQPAADGTISVSLGVGTWVVTIKLPEADVFSQVTSYSTETKLEITQEMIDNGTPASFFLPRVMQQKMPGNGISAACGYKIDVDKTSGDFVALSDRALWAGNMRAPHEASAYYTLDRDFLEPAQVALHDGTAFVLWGNKIRAYDVSTASIAANQVIDCTDGHCFEERAVDGPTFTVAAGACAFGSMDHGSEFDNFKNNVGQPGGPGGGPGGENSGGGEGGDPTPDVNVVGEDFKQDYVSYLDEDTDTVIMSFGNYASFFDANTLEQKRAVTIGRFLDDCGSKYLFVLEDSDEHLLKVVDPVTFSASTVNLNDEIPTLVEVINATTDTASGLTYLSFGGVASDATVGGVVVLDCSDADIVREVQPAKTLFGLEDHVPPGPIQVTSSGRVMYGDSLFESSGSSFNVIATRMLSRIQLSGLSIADNQFKENAPDAGIVFSYGASNALGVAWAGEAQVLGFAVRVSLHDLVHVVNIPGFGAIAIDEKGNMSTIYYNIPDGMDQPPESVDLGEVTEVLDETYHPECGGDPFVACPNRGICIVAEGGFTNDTGECVPNPDGAFCGGADGVSCPEGSTCREEAERGLGYCVPNFDCDPNNGKNCAAGMGCFDLGALKQGGDFCYIDENTGEEVCCHPLHRETCADGSINCGGGGAAPNEYECCGPNGCEHTTQVPELSPYQCIPAAPAGPGLCGGFDGLGCPDNRTCVTGFDFFPADTGLCEALVGEFCHISGQCQGDLICNPLTSQCEAPCQITSDCPAGVCTFQGGDFGYVCDQGFPTRCAPDEIGVWFDGAQCTTEKPCDPWGFSGTGCGEGEACVETNNPETGAWGAFCRPSCEISRDCSGPNEVCLADWSGERSCVDSAQIPPHCEFCEGSTYCHQNSGPNGQGCYTAETPPCSNRHGEGICDDGGLTCNWNMGGICIAECEGKTDCASGQNCAVVDPWQGTNACVTPKAGELECATGHLAFEGSCAVLPTGGCTFGGVGCAAGYQCRENVYGNGQDICVCEDLAACTVCTVDTECPNGAVCNTQIAACEWDTCPNGQEDCEPGELCADWLGSNDMHPPGGPNQGGLTYPRDEAVCVVPGFGGTGDRCATHADCGSFLCDSGACLLVCDTTEDCIALGQTCVAGDPWMGQNYNYCASVAGGNCAIDEVYYPQHQNGPQCSAYAPCTHGPSGPECDAGFVCNQNGNNECQPECSSTADCEPGQNCRTQNVWMNNQDVVVSFCDDVANACNGQQCAGTEKCIDSHSGQICSALEPCGPNGTCSNGYVCDGQNNVCRPSCANTSECGPGENCLAVESYDPQQQQPVVARFCGDQPRSGCPQCGSAESCTNPNWYSVCSELDPCLQGTCEPGFLCDGSTNLCSPTCTSNADCPGAEEQCMIDPWSGATEGQCRVPDSFDNCACPSGLACVQGRGTCVDLAGGACASGSECPNQSDYSCERLDNGNPQSPFMCICLNSNSTECFDCAGDHRLCQGHGGVCGASGLCEMITCDPLDAGSPCPSGTSCIEGQGAWPPEWSCTVPAATRPNGQSCGWGAECASGMCRNGVCVAPCQATADCAGGNCDRYPNEPYGTCASASSCAASCPSTDVCVPGANVCERPCTVTSDCGVGQNCERFPQDGSGVCRSSSGACQGPCAGNEFCNPNTNLCQ